MPNDLPETDFKDVLYSVWRHGYSKRSWVSIEKLSDHLLFRMKNHTQQEVTAALSGVKTRRVLSARTAPLDGTVVDIWVMRKTPTPKRICDCLYRDGKWWAPTGVGPKYVVDGELLGWYPIPIMLDSKPALWRRIGNWITRRVSP